ncbi:MAG: hypothetical protein M3Y07_13735 [Acidobacteriota bacterium]|nr:hypothetical protein [Acidobacteriota bacterium]
MLDAGALIKQHRGKSVLVDTNLLVLLLVGLFNTERIRNFKRTQDFTVEDFHTLEKLVNWFGAPLIATPRIVSQVSDLTDVSGRERIAVRELFKSTIEILEEKYDTAKQLAQHPLFGRFGLGDASIAALCERNVVVLTADVNLQLALGGLGLHAINFNHVRSLGWA